MHNQHQKKKRGKRDVSKNISPFKRRKPKAQMKEKKKQNNVFRKMKRRLGSKEQRETLGGGRDGVSCGGIRKIVLKGGGGGGKKWPDWNPSLWKGGRKHGEPRLFGHRKEHATPR